MRTRYILSFLIIIASFVSACGAGQVETKPDISPPAPPSKGQSTMIGRVLSRDTGKPMTNEIVRLAEVYRQDERGAFVLDMAFSPGARTDENGYFIFENIPAKEYVIVIGNYEAAYDIIEKSGSSTPETYVLKPDQILDVGELKAKPVYHP